MADTASRVSHLAPSGLIDLTQGGIRGGGGSGYATSQALCSYPKVWSGGVSEYGINQLKMFAKDTHRFESQYAQGLLFKDGTAKAEQERIDHDCNPLYHAENITAALLLMQWTEYHVVPPSQAQEIEKIVRLIFFVGKGHGFRRDRSILRSIDEESWWVKHLVRP